MKTSSGLPLGLEDFFPDLAVSPRERQPEEPNLRLIKGADPGGDEGVIAGWDRWATICQMMAKRRNRGMVGVA
jgi:hypothetical protein